MLYKVLVGDRRESGDVFGLSTVHVNSYKRKIGTRGKLQEFEEKE